MNEADYPKFVETGLRRPLTAEEARQVEHLLDRHPGLRQSWSLDDALNTSLRSLPDAPLTPGFVMRVLAEIERPVASPAPSRGLEWLAALSGRWWRPAIFASMLLAGGFFTIHTYQIRNLETLARNATWFASLATIHAPAASAGNTHPSAFTWLEDYSAISLMPSGSEIGVAADTDLLAALK